MEGYTSRTAEIDRDISVQISPVHNSIRPSSPNNLAGYSFTNEFFGSNHVAHL